MKVKLITMTDDLNHPGLKQLERSLKHFNWDYEILERKYIAFGSKQVAFYEYMKAHPEYTHLFIVDAHDVFVLNTMDHALTLIEFLYGLDCILFNAEKACWPYEQWATKYPFTTHDWKYLNGGAAFVNCAKYIEMFEENPIKHTDNDQVELARIFLEKRNNYNFQLDNLCAVFQSIAFEGEEDFALVRGRLFNRKTIGLPTIIHGNGKTDITKIYNLIPYDNEQ